MGNQTYQERTFQAVDGDVTFCIGEIDCLFPLTPKHVERIIKKGEGFIQAHIVKNGIGFPIEKNLQKMVVDEVRRLCDSVDISSHIHNKSRDDCRDRGWPTDKDELTEKVEQAVKRVVGCDQATIKFSKNGKSRPKLFYRVYAEFPEENKRYYMAVMFEEGVVVVTILRIESIDRLMRRR